MSAGSPRRCGHRRMSRCGARARMRSSHGCASSPVTARRIAGISAYSSWLRFCRSGLGHPLPLARAGGGPAPSISAGDRVRVIHDRGLRIENPALANPCLSLGVDVLPVRQKHDSLPARETTHVDPRLVAVGDLVEVEVLVLFRREVQIHLRALEAVHVFVDVGRIDVMRQHERDHERRVDDLAEPELFENLIGYPPDARRRHVAFDAGIDPRPGRADELQLDLLAIEERLERLQRGEMAAGMVADRHVLSGQCLRSADRRSRRHPEAPRRDHVGLAPHPSDLLGGRLIDRPVACAGNVRFDTLVAFALLIGFERAGKDIDDLAGGIDLLLALRRQAAAKLIIEARIAEIALLVSYPFLQTPMRLDREFRHDASPNSTRPVTMPRVWPSAHCLSENRQESPTRASWKTRAPARRRPWAFPASCSRAARPERYATPHWSFLMPERDRRSTRPPEPGGPDRPIGCKRAQTPPRLRAGNRASGCGGRTCRQRSRGVSARGWRRGLHSRSPSPPRCR